MRNELISLIDKFFLKNYTSFFENINAFADDDKQVSYREFNICDLIERHPGCNLSFLAKRLEISNPAVTQQINSLIKKGYVDKNHIEEDKRNKGLNITDSYKSLIDKANNKIFGSFHDELTEKERDFLVMILKKSMEHQK